jgi:ABC-type branched-subunit amino acid transport system substrate-binding protein
MAADLRARFVALLGVLLLGLTACAPAEAAPLRRIALLAPFEGRYREIGYDALYPLRLALRDAQSDLVLMSVDDGGTPEQAALNVQRIANDPTVLAAVVVGPYATQPAVLAAFGDLPVVVVGLWSAQPAEGVYLLASPDLPDLRTRDTADIRIAVDSRAGVGGEVFALKQFVPLRRVTTNIVVALSATPPTAEFAQRLTESDLFVPPAGALATITYDAGGLLHTALTGAQTRAQAQTSLSAADYTGLNGRIRFDTAGWWQDAPVVRYVYDAAGALVTAPAP